MNFLDWILFSMQHAHGSQEVFKLVTYPVVHLTSFQTKYLPPNPIFCTKTKLIPTRKLRTMTSFLWHFSIQY